MIQSIRCDECQQELIFPEEWVDRSIQCPRCRKVTTLTPARVGGDVAAPGATRTWRVLGAVSTIAVIASVLILFSGRKADVIIRDMPVGLRCADCGRMHQEDRRAWEQDVMAALGVSGMNSGGDTPLQVPELTPVRCPHCMATACYLATNMAHCARCGHWAPVSPGALATALVNLPPCLHCERAEQEQYSVRY